MSTKDPYHRLRALTTILAFIAGDGSFHATPQRLPVTGLTSVIPDVLKVLVGAVNELLPYAGMGDIQVKGGASRAARGRRAGEGGGGRRAWGAAGHPRRRAPGGWGRGRALGARAAPHPAPHQFANRRPLRPPLGALPATQDERHHVPQPRLICRAAPRPRAAPGVVARVSTGGALAPWRPGALAGACACTAGLSRPLGAP